MAAAGMEWWPTHRPCGDRQQQAVGARPRALPSVSCARPSAPARTDPACSWSSTSRSSTCAWLARPAGRVCPWSSSSLPRYGLATGPGAGHRPAGETASWRCFPAGLAIYEAAGVPVEFVGHPPPRRALPPGLDPRAGAWGGIEPDLSVVGLFPGSRREEISRLSPAIAGRRPPPRRARRARAAADPALRAGAGPIGEIDGWAGGPLLATAERATGSPPVGSSSTALTSSWPPPNASSSPRARPPSKLRSLDTPTVVCYRVSRFTSWRSRASSSRIPQDQPAQYRSRPRCGPGTPAGRSLPARG